jgi:hypothetical protein
MFRSDQSFKNRLSYLLLLPATYFTGSIIQVEKPRSVPLKLLQMTQEVRTDSWKSIAGIALLSLVLYGTGYVALVSTHSTR